MRLVAHHCLNVIGFPQSKLLLFRTFLLSVFVQMLKHDGRRFELFREIHNELSRQNGDAVIDAVCRSPESRSLFRSMLLCLFDAVDGMIQTVLLSRQFQEPSAEDSAVVFHDRNGAGIQDAEVNSKDRLLFIWFFIQVYGLFESEIQKPFFSAFSQGRNALFAI